MRDIPPLEDLMLEFESFGDNCEFGLVQRIAGLEPLGLLRFSFSPMESLLRGLGNRFAGVAALENVQITVANNKELMARVLGYDFTYHTGRHEGEISLEALQRDEKTKLGFLSRRLLGTLATGEKIFVRKGQNCKTLAQAKTLLAAMREHGPATLLWVTEVEGGNTPGSVTLEAPHLIHGRVKRLAPYDDAHSIDFTRWIEVCRGAYALWKSDWAVGTTLMPPARNNLDANLLHGGMIQAPGEQPPILLLSHAIRNQPDSIVFPRRERGRPSICHHTMTKSDENAMVGARVSGLAPGEPYTFSLWLRQPQHSKLTMAMLQFPGDKMLRTLRWNKGQRETWMPMEITGIAPANGIMFPRLKITGAPGSTFETANWRLEPGLLVQAVEPPPRPAQTLLRAAQ